MADDVKEMTAQLKVETWAEMDKKTKEWFLSIPLFKKKLPEFEYSQTARLDGRKWDPGKLESALKTLVRYELKLFAARGVDWIKKIDKQGPKAQAECEKAYPKYHEELAKKMASKCSTALDELESGKADSKKALAAGKAALKKFDSLSLNGLFIHPTKATVTAFVGLADGLKKAAGNRNGEEAAFVAASNATDIARDGFEANAKQAQNTVKYLLKTGADLEKDTKADKSVRAFGAFIQKNRRLFSEFVDNIEAFEVDIDAAYADIASRNLDDEAAVAKAKTFAKYAKLESSAKTVVAIVKKLKPAFAKIEKKLK